MSPVKYPKIDGYRLDELLGQGGQGAVFGGTRLSDGRKVAIKVLRNDFGERQGQAITRFHREIAVSKNFAHANVIRILDGGLLPNGQAFLAMDFLEGESLFARLMKGCLTTEEVIPIYLELAEALDYIHAKGLVHRDIKPANVWLCKDGRTVLLDFGLCFVSDITRITKTGNIVGTVATMAPEQIQGVKVTPQTDIYSLGATMYLATTGDPPYRIEDLMLVGVGRQPRLITPPCEQKDSVSEHLSGVIMKSIQVDAELRYQSAQELRAALLDDGTPINDTIEVPPKIPPKTPKVQKRNYRPMTVATLLLVVVLSLIASMYSSPKKEKTPTQFNLTAAYKKLLKQKSWSNKELTNFGKKVISLGRADKFDVHKEATDPFVVGSYSVIKSLSRVVNNEVTDGASVVTPLMRKLFEHLGKKSLSAPNRKFMSAFILEHHLAQEDKKSLSLLQKLLDEVTEEQMRLDVEFRLAEALHLSAAHERLRFHSPKPPQNVLQAHWLITPAIERYYKGTVPITETNVSPEELITKYAQILENIRTEDSKKELSKLIKHLSAKDDLNEHCRCAVFHSAATVFSNRLRGEKNVRDGDIELSIVYAKKAVHHAPLHHRSHVLLDLLTNAQHNGFLTKFKKELRVKTSDFPAEELYRYYMVEAEHARASLDFTRAMRQLRKAISVAPKKEKTYVRMRIEEYQAEMGSVLGIGGIARKRALNKLAPGSSTNLSSTKKRGP